MTEDDAKDWIQERFGSAAIDRLSRFVAMVVEENSAQNLIAPSTVPTIWVRHVLDSAQLIAWAGRVDGCWVDIGTGGGFPGIIIALLADYAVELVEPRRRRSEFLSHCIQTLGIDNARVRPCPVERVSVVADIISARAVASPEKLLRNARHCATSTTRWVLPRGQTSQEETLALRRQWKGMFHVEHSITAPESSIFLLEGSLT